MPDLSKESIHAFWDSYDRKTLYRIIVALENVEHWVVDEDEKITPKMEELGEAIDNARSFDIDNEDLFIRMLANIRSSKAMRILQALDAEKPGTASQLLMHAEEQAEDSDDTSGNKYSKLFIRRNLVFERLQLLSRVFAPQRISLILNSLERAEEDAAS